MAFGMNARARETGIPADTITAKVWERELTMSTSLGNGAAVPHGTLDELDAPVIAFGISRAGLDFIIEQPQAVAFCFTATAVSRFQETSRA